MSPDHGSLYVWWCAVWRECGVLLLSLTDISDILPSYLTLPPHYEVSVGLPLHFGADRIADAGSVKANGLKQQYP